MMIMTKFLSIIASLVFTMLCIGSVESLKAGGKWKQLGNTLEGVVGYGYLGYDVEMSSDGNTIAVLAVESVAVYTYNPLSRNWIQIGTDIVYSSPYGIFGNNIVMSADGKTIVLGLPYSDDVHGCDTGAVQVHAFDAAVGNWIQVGTDIHGELEGEQFGTFLAVSADGKTIAVNGVNYNNIEGGRDVVRVYAFNSIVQVWSQVGNTIKGEEGLDQQLIASIDMSANGKTIAIGVINDYDSDNGVNNNGYVRAFRFTSITKQWKPIGSVISGESEYYSIAFSIGMSGNGNTIAIGGALNDGNGIDSGRVRVYSFNHLSGQWIQVGKDIDGEAAFDYSGSSVAISYDGKTIAIWAPGNDNPNGSDSGHVRVYSYIPATRIWTQIGTDINGISGDSLGMSADGSTILVSAPSSDFSRGDIGTADARVYKYKPPKDCTISWRLYNLQNNTIVASLVNGTKVRKPPPCGYANIEAYVPCAVNATSHAVTMELYDNQGNLYRRRTDTTLPYFLYGKYGNIKAGNYTIRAIVNQTVNPFISFVTPYTKFTLLGACA